MLYKDTKSDEIINSLKLAYTELQTMHLEKSGDFETLLDEGTLKAAGMSLKGNFMILNV
jgi:hypothetical protein